ncbi:hypothetical protein EH223_11180 [candidate division KSB1 bacterium]|nr:hypothetical protein [candidate division KSB1 bacterium]RQW03002.1 MAG: hypothetical protein EH223_11180 [candidate division KSB1 bacterium]
MKKSILLFLLFVLTAVAFGQRFEFSGAVGYQFGGAVDESLKDEGDDVVKDGLGIKASAALGLYASYWIAPKVRCELSFDVQPTFMNYHHANETITKMADMSVSYYQLGFLYDWSKENIRPFAGFSAGLADFSLAGDYKAERRLVVSPVLGVKLVAGPHFAFRLQTRVLMSNMPAGDIFCNTDTGACFTHHKSTFVSQIQLLTGIIWIL